MAVLIFSMNGTNHVLICIEASCVVPIGALQGISHFFEVHRIKWVSTYNQLMNIPYLNSLTQLVK